MIGERIESGLGNAVVSNRLWSYPVRVGSECTELEIFEFVGEDPRIRHVPALISLDQMGRMADAIGVHSGLISGVRVWRRSCSDADS